MLVENHMINLVDHMTRAQSHMTKRNGCVRVEK